ncbi:unnamed protein product [Oppiella nova]|uniref:Carboxylic ester hydrolase n=1 Tax=Oppiella nova TaxID=334625 RepID=A0A7R9QGR6_9ACAR|nr:unnamed protein product [Oppiella nova]CAG2164679.1 unnamed protein product [Oppiella nova]
MSVSVEKGVIVGNTRPTVDGKQGVIVGNTRPTVDGKQVNEFLGIPYAKPPKGDLRFRKPVPTDSWSQPLVADKWPNACSQLHIYAQYYQNKNISEDCLYLNIWAPTATTMRSGVSGRKASKQRSTTSGRKTSRVSKRQSAGLKPVMFYAHGGGFSVGSSNQFNYRGEVLATKGDVIVVTINYRLNAFGFLYTGTDDGPGNVGLWDHALALEWVHKNIKSFGGDPEKITIFGTSAGSMTSSALVLSPITRNLFKNAILMSGSALGEVTGNPDEMKQYWLQVAKYVNCVDDETPGTFTPKVINCLKAVDQETLATYSSAIAYEAGGALNLVSFLVADGTFLPKKPHEMLISGDFRKDMNLMIGNCEDEGSNVLMLFATNLGEDPKKYDSHNPTPITYTEAYNTTKNLFSSLALKPRINGEDVAKLYFTGLSDKTSQDILRRSIESVQNGSKE